MPAAPHTEHHFTASETVRDVVIGMSDGLTVPFALAAGLSGAKVGTSVVVLAGLAEIAAGSIAMGLGGYLAARTDQEHYQSERQREIREAREIPEEEAAEVSRVFEGWGLTPQQIRAHRGGHQFRREALGRFHDAVRTRPRGAGSQARRPQRLHHRNLVHRRGPDPARAVFFHGRSARQGLTASVAVTLSALFIFGCIKARFTGISLWRGGLQTTLIGGLAAAAAFAIARLFR